MIRTILILLAAFAIGYGARQLMGPSPVAHTTRQQATTASLLSHNSRGARAHQDSVETALRNPNLAAKHRALEKLFASASLKDLRISATTCANDELAVTLLMNHWRERNEADLLRQAAQRDHPLQYATLHWLLEQDFNRAYEWFLTIAATTTCEQVMLRKVIADHPDLLSTLALHISPDAIERYWIDPHSLTVQDLKNLPKGKFREELVDLLLRPMTDALAPMTQLEVVREFGPDTVLDFTSRLRVDAILEYASSQALPLRRLLERNAAMKMPPDEAIDFVSEHFTGQLKNTTLRKLIPKLDLPPEEKLQRSQLITSRVQRARTTESVMSDWIRELNNAPNRERRAAFDETVRELMIENEGYHGDLAASWPNFDHLGAAEFVQTADPDLDLDGLAQRVSQRMGPRESPEVVMQWLLSLTERRRLYAMHDAISRTNDLPAMKEAIAALPNSNFKTEATRIYQRRASHE